MNNTAALPIDSDITGVELVDQTKAPMPTIDPDTIRIEQRPEGLLSGDTNKLIFFTQEGRKTMYISINYIVNDGILRPCEAFIPASQSEEDHQWESAVARTISYIFRQGGDVSKVLMDLTFVTWSKGPVRCGLNEHQKPRFHNSIVAMVAWGFLEMLKFRGILDSSYNWIPAERRKSDQPTILNSTMMPIEHTKASEKSAGECPECGGRLKAEEGCLSCTTCAYTKCG